MRLATSIARPLLLYSLVLGFALLGLWLYAGSNGAAVILALIVGVCAIALVAAVLAARRGRLEAIEALARSLAAGRFDERLEPGDDEYGDLVVALNDAAARISSLVGMLRGERAQLESLLNSGSDATIAVDAGAAIVYMNDGAREMFGPGARLGRPFIEVVRDHDLNDVIVGAAARGERSVRVVPYEPAQRWLQATAVPIHGAGEWAALAVFHDLTEVRRLDSVRRDFISNVSHELRTPLAGIRAATETLQEGAIDDKPAAREFLGHIQRETDRMTQMVDELLELSRIESGASPMSFDRIDARELLGDAAKRFAQQAERAGVALCADPSETPLMIYADAERLERAIGNLVANAIRFTPAGGSITIRAEPVDGHVAISVEDTGVGIPSDEQARVFERFYKADRGRGDTGVGLGLAIVKHTVLAHQGTVSVESRPGRGARFTIRIPRR